MEISICYKDSRGEYKSTRLDNLAEHTVVAKTAFFEWMAGEGLFATEITAELIYAGEVIELWDYEQGNRWITVT